MKLFSDQYIELPIDDLGHKANVKVSDIHAITDTLDTDICSLYTGQGNIMVPVSRVACVALIDAWYTAQMHKVN